jgi:hypothetical protein
MLHIAATQPATFLGIAARLIPQQVQMDLHAVLPGNLSPTTGPIFGSFFRPSSRPFQMLLIVHPEPYFSMSWPSCKTDHFQNHYVTSSESTDRWIGPIRLIPRQPKSIVM